MKKISLFIAVFAVVPFFVCQMASANCSVGQGAKAECLVSGGKSCPMDHTVVCKKGQKGTPKFNFVSANKKTK